MRLVNKYKILKIQKLVSKRYPKRILNFKRPKWLFLKNYLLSLNETSQKINDITAVFNNFKTWERKKKIFTRSLYVKNSVLNIFDKSLKFKSLNKSKSLSKLRQDAVLTYFLKSFYRIDILLWYLNFFKSSFEARQYINKGSVLVNGKTIKSNIFLKKGDCINIKLNNNFFLRSNSNLYLKNKFFLTFVEFDYYINEVVIIKDLNNLHLDDFYIMLSDYLNVKHLNYNF